MKWLFLILGLSIHLYAGPFDEVAPSTPDEIASLNAALVVDGFVSAMSGQLSLSEVDLRVRGAQDLVLKRTYIPPQVLGRYKDKNEKDRLELGNALRQLNTKGWVVLPHLWAGYNRNSPYFQIRDPQGHVLEFQIQGNRGILKTSPYGCTNLQLGEPNSFADIRNIELRVENNQIKVTWPDGTQRIFTHQLQGLYRLDSELLPNGKAVRYYYNAQGLTRIASTDATGKYTYASLDRVGRHHYRGSDGREVLLTYESREIKGGNKKERLKAKFTFPVMTKALNPNYNNTVGYNDRTLLTSYDAKAYPISCSYFQQKGVLARIQTFSTHPDPLSPSDHSNLYQYVFNNPYRFQDPNGESVLGFLCGIGQIALGGAIMASGVAIEIASFGGYTFAFGLHEAAGLSLMATGCAMAAYHAQSIPTTSYKNTNPFEGAVGEEIFIGDAEGNIIPVPEGQWLTGSSDGKWIQVREPSGNPRGKPTGVRKDGGHPQGPKHPDSRAWEPHGHQPGVTNPDGTPWLPIY